MSYQGLGTGIVGQPERNFITLLGDDRLTQQQLPLFIDALEKMVRDARRVQANSDKPDFSDAEVTITIRDRSENQLGFHRSQMVDAMSDTSIAVKEFRKKMAELSSFVAGVKMDIRGIDYEVSVRSNQPDPMSAMVIELKSYLPDVTPTTVFRALTVSRTPVPAVA